jgi:hypothetical protein
MKPNPKVLNKSWNEVPPDSIYIGRPSKWGNPFSHKAGTLAKYKVDSREEAVKKHKDWIDSILLRDPSALDRLKQELKGKDLVCWCKPAACHGDYLLTLANS